MTSSADSLWHGRQCSQNAEPRWDNLRQVHRIRHNLFVISGIVTTTRITHATPAALYSHTPNRDWEADTWYENECKDVKDIAKQLIENDVGQKLDLIFGGGRRNFILESDGGKRKDEDLIDAWKKKKGENGAVLQNITQLKDWNEEGFALGNKFSFLR